MQPESYIPRMSSPDTSVPAAHPHASFRPGVWITGILLLAMATGGYWYWNRGAEAPREGRGRFGPGGPNQAVPVRVVPVRQEPIEVQIFALGTVTPMQTVTVRSRIDGELVRVLFTEGQHVAAGQLLAEIDPRPSQAALTQAAGHARREPGAAAECAERPRHLPAARQRRPDHQAAGHDAGSAGRSVSRRAPGERGAGQQRQSAAQLHPDRGAHRRPARAAAGRRRQPDSERRHQRPRRHHADAADLGALHRAGNRSAGGAGGLPPRAPAARGGVGSRRNASARGRRRCRPSTTRSTRRPAPSSCARSSRTTTSRCSRTSSSTSGCGSTRSRTRRSSRPRPCSAGRSARSSTWSRTTARSPIRRVRPRSDAGRLALPSRTA